MLVAIRILPGHHATAWCQGRSGSRCTAVVIPPPRERGTETMKPAQSSHRLAIQVLGAFRVSVGSRAIDEQEWTSRKARSLVKLLALAPHHHLHREQIMERLW